MTTMDIIIAFCQEENHMMHGMRNFAEARVALHAYVSSRPSERTYTLERMMQLMAYLGHPQDTLKIMHVAGTSGKSATAYYAAALLMAAGKRVGLTVSPHAVEVNDRVQINLTPLPEQTFCQELSVFLGLVTKSGITPTYFELLIAFAYWEFVCQRVDYAVVEVGLGCMVDATNVITRRD